MANHLINETSPYLLQHAHNPVDWYPWGDAALEKAKSEDKPILVSIGYAACHWCHVMEWESFEDEATAAFMNVHFVCIKIDREERPDLDAIYMDAVQLLTGSGGWPLNVFLTPDKKPFYGGTYFPPRAMANRPSWMDVLMAVSDAFKSRRADMEDQANKLVGHIQKTGSPGAFVRVGAPGPTTEQADIAVLNLLKQADKQWGGFGNPPKFPQFSCLQFLLRFGNGEKSRVDSQAADARQHALLSLDKIIEGGIYDQVGGGMARYSTDREWLAPHFEKMLYDNALLVSLLSESFQLTGSARYKETLEQTLDFIEREMTSPEGGFYAALDADSEGEEGKFYTWSYDEIEQLLGEDAGVFAAYYDVTEKGNWEEKNILRILQSPEQVARDFNISVEELRAILRTGCKKLLEARETRIRPALDDKIILSWNALMNLAYSKAYAATGNDDYLQTALKNMAFLLKVFPAEDELYFHTWKNGQAKYPAFLDDYAFLIQAMLQLLRSTGNTDWLDQASQVAQRVIKHFSISGDLFYFTPEGQQDIILRKTEIYDSATPSGNAVMAQNLYELGILLDRPEWTSRAVNMVNGLHEMITKYPGSFGAWACDLYQILKGSEEIVLIGDTEAAHKEILETYLPHALLMTSETGNDDYPLLKDKKPLKRLTIFLCRNYACKEPVFSVQALKQQLEAVTKNAG